jgi:hypothetical protein
MQKDIPEKIFYGMLNSVHETIPGIVKHNQPTRYLELV